MWALPFRVLKQMVVSIIGFFVFLVLISALLIGIGIGLGGMLSEESGEAVDKPLLNYQFVSGKKESENRLLLLPIEGLILGSPIQEGEFGFWDVGMTYGYRVQGILEKVAKDERVKGVFLHIRTPGGTIFGSQAIFEGIRGYREVAKKPVFAYIEGLSASGGVMAMVGADAIYADYGSYIGSIGVMGFNLSYFDKPMAMDGGLLGEGITTAGGIEYTILHAGKGKDLGNPFRRATPEELSNLQRGLDNEYANFVRHVAANRQITEAVIREEMGAQVFDNATAESYKLIDGTLNRQQTLNKLAEKAGIGEDYQLVRFKGESGSMFESLLARARAVLPMQVNSVEVAERGQLACHTMISTPLVYYGDLPSLCSR